MPVSQNVKFVLKFTSRRILLIFGQRIHWKASKSFLSWLCQYLLFSINRCFLNIFFNRLKVCGYPTLLISWFILALMWNLRHIWQDEDIHSYRLHEKYQQSDWLRGVHYWPYFYSVFNMCILWLNKKKMQHSNSVAEK